MTEDNDEAQRDEPISATAVIGMFGGIRPMAKKLGIAVTTVQGWKERDMIPAARHGDVLEAAQRHGIPLSAADLGDAPAVEGSDIPAPPRHEDETPTPSPLARAAGGPDAQPAREDWLPETPEAAETDQAAAEGETARQTGAEPTEIAAASSGAGRGRSLSAALVVVLVIAAGGVFAWWQWVGGAEMLAGRGPALAAAEAEIAAAKQSAAEANAAVAELRATVDELGSQLAEAQQRAAEPAGLDVRVQALEARPEPSPVPADLGDRLDSLGRIEARLAALEEAVAAAASGDGGVQAAALEVLAGRLSDLETAVQDQAVVIALDSRIAALESIAQDAAAEPPDPNQGALVVAVGQLRDALRGSGPYAAEIEAIRALAADDADVLAALDALAVHADQGIPTAAELRERFDARAGAIVRAARLPASPRWYDRALYQVTSLATVRRTGDVEGDGPEALVARAELSLAKGDLAGAVEALDGLQDRAAAVAESWLEDARQRLAAEAQLKALQRAALVRVEPGPAPADGSAAEAAGAADAPADD